MTTNKGEDVVLAIAATVRGVRRQQGLTQARLAEKAGVSRLFVIELEGGHPRAELGKVLSVLDALEINPFVDQPGSPVGPTSSGEEAGRSATIPPNAPTTVAGTPYEPAFVIADDLSSLHGPSSGEVVLPNRLLWNPSRPFDLSDERRLRSMIRIVLREARSQDDLSEYVDRNSLVRLWNGLGLPDRVRKGWEARFPELVAAGDR